MTEFTFSKKRELNQHKENLIINQPRLPSWYSIPHTVIGFKLIQEYSIEFIFGMIKDKLISQRENINASKQRGRYNIKQ